MNILRMCQNQNQVKNIENGQQPAPRAPQNSYSVSKTNVHVHERLFIFILKCGEIFSKQTTNGQAFSRNVSELTIDFRFYGPVSKVALMTNRPMRWEREEHI